MRSIRLAPHFRARRTAARQPRRRPSPLYFSYLLVATLMLGMACGSLAFGESSSADPRKASSTESTTESTRKPATNSATNPTTRPTAERSEEELDGEEVPELDEILRLRRLVGDPFRGTVLESTGGGDGKSGADQFAGALRKVVQEGSARQSPDLERQPASREQCEDWYRELLQGETGRDQVVVPSTLPPLTGQATPSAGRLRLLARQIGESADDLEDLGRYSEADALREVAHRLRQDARNDQSMSFD
jgi:hypothetical protein